MGASIWILVPLVAIIGGLIIEYQKNKIKMMGKSRQNSEEVDELRKLVTSLKGRVENLEAIAAGTPDEFSSGAGKGLSEIEIADNPSTKEDNQEQVSNLADKRRAR